MRKMSLREQLINYSDEHKANWHESQRAKKFAYRKRNRKETEAQNTAVPRNGDLVNSTKEPTK